MNLWDELARQDAEKFIYTGEKDFRKSGADDYKDLIKDDPTLEPLRPFKDKIVLEIGCGIGRMTEFIAKDFKRVYAIDSSGEMIARAGYRLQKIENINWILSDGESLPPIGFDFIFSFATFQHCDKETVYKNFRQFRKILKKKGMAKIQVRGEPHPDPRKWSYGDYFKPEDIGYSILPETKLKLIKVEGIGKRYLWLWLKKG